jgi:hypothetical protein
MCQNHEYHQRTSHVAAAAAATIFLRVLITQSNVILIDFHPHYVKLNLPSGYKTIACLNYASNADFTLFPVAAFYSEKPCY